MLFALGAVSSAIDAFQSLTSSTSSPVKTGVSQSTTASFDPAGTATASTSPGVSSGSGGGNCIAPATMSALLAAQGQSLDAPTTTSVSSALQDLFSQIDGNGDGAISKSEFESALGAGGTNLAQADDVFGKLDTNGDGSVSLDEMSSALKGAGGHGHHHAHHAGGAKSSDEDSLLQALDGASSTSTTNSDGSTTTSLIYADGSTVMLTMPAPQTSSSSASSSYNVIEQAIQREAQAVSASTAQSLSVSV
jgi:hypothetical protein